MFPQKRPQPECPMSRGFLLDRDADVEGRVVTHLEAGETLAQPARTGKQIDNTEFGWQIRGLSSRD
jgi:hypothetical protein